MMTGNDLAALLNPFVILGALVIVAVILGGPRLRDRYIFRELNHDTGVTRQRPTALSTPDRASNPPLVYFLDLHYAERLDTVLMLHCVGAIASLHNGSMTMHDRAGRLLTDLSALDVAYYRRLNDTAPAPQPDAPLPGASVPLHPRVSARLPIHSTTSRMGAFRPSPSACTGHIFNSCPPIPPHRHGSH